MIAHPRLISERGVTLVEITIVLLVVSILAAAAAPTAKRTIDLAKISRTFTDEAAIKTAITNFLSDTAFIGFATNGVAPVANTATNLVETLVSDGDIPPCTAGVVQGCTTAPLWTNVVANGAPAAASSTDFLERHLVTNNPGGSVADDYPLPGWKGAYINAPIDPDPWGNRYAVNVRWLVMNSACGTRSNDTFVLSAGPNEQIDTPYRVDANGVTPTCTANTVGTGGSTPGGGDIITVIRRDVGVTVP